MLMAYTLQDIYNTAYGIIAQWQDATAYPLTLMLSFINKAQNDICYGTLQNLSTNERLTHEALTFLEGSTFYSTKMYSTLSSDAVQWGSTLTSTNTFTSSGYLWINGNIISYSSNDGTTISGIPTSGDGALQFPHIAGSQVLQLEVLPTDFGILSRCMIQVQNSLIRQALVPIDSRDINSVIPRAGIQQNMYFNTWYNTGIYSREYYYSMLRGQYILFMTMQQSGQPIEVEYEKKPTQLVNTTDLVTIPDDYSLSTIPYIAVAEMLANRWEMDEAMKLQNFWFNAVKSMYQRYRYTRMENQYNQTVSTTSNWFMRF